VSSCVLLWDFRTGVVPQLIVVIPLESHGPLLPKGSSQATSCHLTMPVGLASRWLFSRMTALGPEVGVALKPTRYVNVSPW